MRLSAQDTAFKLLHIYPYAITDFTVDNLGNLFVLNDAQQVKKISPEFDSLAVFNDIRRYGQLYAIDASNPLKILLFYKDFSTIVVLDRFLNIRNSIDLRLSDIVQCSAIAQSYDNNIWVFDEFNSKVKKLDENGKLLLESPDFRVVFSNPPHPYKLEDYNRFLYAYDSSQGLLVMDYFGAYKNLVAYKGWRNVHGIAKGLVATDSTGLIYFQPGNVDIQHQKLPPDILQSKKIRINGTKLYSLGADGNLSVYQL